MNDDAESLILRQEAFFEMMAKIKKWLAGPGLRLPASSNFGSIRVNT